MPSNFIRSIGCALIAALAASCSSSAHQPGDKPSSRDSMASAAAVDTSTARERRAALGAYLAAALYTHSGKIPDSLAACDDDFAPPKRLALAAYDVLQATGDTGTTIPARIVSVAEFDPSEQHAEKTIATVRVRVDTLHWNVVRDTSKTRWVVCGFAKEGFDFADSTSEHNVDWRPAGASAAAMTHLADSVSLAKKPQP